MDELKSKFALHEQNFNVLQELTMKQERGIAQQNEAYATNRTFFKSELDSLKGEHEKESKRLSYVLGEVDKLNQNFVMKIQSCEYRIGVNETRGQELNRLVKAVEERIPANTD